MEHIPAISPQEAKEYVQKHIGIKHFNGINPIDALNGATYPAGRNDVCVLSHTKAISAQSNIRQLICVYKDSNGVTHARMFYRTSQQCSLTIRKFTFSEDMVQIDFMLIPQKSGIPQHLTENISFKG